MLKILLLEGPHYVKTAGYLAARCGLVASERLLCSRKRTLAWM